MTAKLHPALRRINGTVLEVQNPQEVPARIYTNPEVQVENSAVEELLNFLKVAEDLPEGAALTKVVATPDFHRGKGIPIGTVALVDGAVLPQAIGSDVGCGVSLLTTDVPTRDLTGVWPQLQQRLRHLFFEGGRDIPMSPEQREALLLRGPLGLFDVRHINEGRGLWQYYHADQQVAATDCYCGPSKATAVWPGFRNYVVGSGSQDSRDAQIGSVGGGNHFVEIQETTEVLDGFWAHHWGLKPGYCCVMVHSGSVSLGYAVGSHFVDQAKRAWPKGKAKPASGFYSLAGDQVHHYIDQYLTAETNAVNFAAGNRLFLGLMVMRALSEVLDRPVNHALVWDAAHNWIERQGNRYLHRKGACPAREGMEVLIPGSMGSSSYVLLGQGNQEALQSACHGAGRQMSRGKAMKVEAGENLRVVTPVDPESPQIRGRRDILKKYEQRLAEEAPSAYKPVGPVIDTIHEAGIARPVARLRPLLTVKG